MRLTVDTDVVAAAMRSPTGASAALLALLLEGKASWLLSVAMAYEYEVICMLAEHRLAANASGIVNLRPYRTRAGLLNRNDRRRIAQDRIRRQ